MNKPPELIKDHTFDHAWHLAINQFTETKRKEWDKWRFMYEAKHVCEESWRLALLFERERTGQLCQTHHQCSHDVDGSPVHDNHLTCCLGVECRKCEALLALEKAVMPPEQIDQAKAWTCVAHVVGKGGDVAGEGYVLTVDDRMYWDNVYESLSSQQE